jgi:hypothetical protein
MCQLLHAYALRVCFTQLMNAATNIKPEPAEDGLVDALRLLELEFPNPACRPSLRWLRGMQKQKQIPYVKLGRLVFFSRPQFRRAVAQKMVLPRGYHSCSLPQ